MKSFILLFALSVNPLPAGSSGFTDLTGAAVETEEDQVVRELADGLKRSENLRRGVAQRILASSLGAQFSEAQDPVGAVASWIGEHPGDAAQLAVGFAKDDHDGTHRFEESLTSRVQRYFELNPKRHQGLYGTLDAAGSESKSILTQEDLPDEERRELLKRFFEGKGEEASRTLGGPQEDGGAQTPQQASHAPAFAGAGMADRLSALNPTGYSPQVVTYQSALNARRPPGTPKLIETGKLDHATLSYPLHGLRYDGRRLDQDLSRHRAWAIAKALGRELKPSQYSDPAVLRSLEKGRAGLKLPPAFLRRRTALDKARQAADEFQRAADRTKDSSRISPALLKELGRRQKEAARWIAIASLEADLQRLEEERFLDRELDDAIAAAPVPEEARAAYRARAQALLLRLQDAADFSRKALEILSGPDHLKLWSSAESLSASGIRARAGLSSDISFYRTLPFQLNAAVKPRSSWQEFLYRWIRRLAPDSARARRLAVEERRAAALRQAFARTASGDFKGARQSLLAP